MGLKKHHEDGMEKQPNRDREGKENKPENNSAGKQKTLEKGSEDKHRKKKKRYKGSRPMKGTWKVFKGQDVNMKYEALKILKDRGFDIPNDTLREYRRSFKRAIADHIAAGAENVGMYEVINQSSRNTIENELARNNDINDNVACIIMYYNAWNNQPYAKKRSRKVEKKNIHQILSDCEEAEKHYIKPFAKTRRVVANGDLIRQIESMNSSIRFVKYFFSSYFLRYTPAKLSPNIYQSALAYDRENKYLEQIYTYDAQNKLYKATRRMKYRSIEQACAVYIICKTMPNNVI